MQEAANPIGTIVRVREADQRRLDFFERADADFIPIEEVVFEASEGLAGLLLRGLFVAESIHDRFKDREPNRTRLCFRLVPFFQKRMDVGQVLRFALCSHGVLLGAR